MGFVLLAACRSGFDEHDARVADDASGDAVGDALPHVGVAPGWTKAVFVDFSADFTYVTEDFVDVNGVVADNRPDGLTVLSPPFAEILAVVAGRTIIELSTGRYVEHDFGMHAPETANPDELTNMSLVADTGSGPRLVVGSSSESNGDGLFFVNSAWSIARDMSLNNVRCFLWDAAGTVQGAPRVFVGTGGGTFVRPDTSTAVLFGDIKSIVSIPNGVVFARELVDNTDTRLVRATWNGTSFVEAEIAVREEIEFAEGDRPSGALAWAITDLEQLVELANDGTATMIATTSQPGYEWRAAAAPPIGHSLAAKRSIYVLESNRDMDIDRVLVFTQE